MPSTVQRHPLVAQTAQVLLERIRAGEWLLGHRLPGETTLAVQLGVGRSTLREAVRELAGKGVLDSRHGSGVFVTALDATEDWGTVLGRAPVVAVLEGRVAIETESAALAAERRSGPELRAMRRALAARATTGRTVEAYVDADMALHRSIVVGAHNEVLLELFDGFVPRVRQAMVVMLRLRPLASPDTDQAAHATLVEAIADHDPRLAAELSRAHLCDLKAAFA